MDGRFLIYEGFEKDVEVVFKELIEKFNFTVTSKSDSGVLFENKRIELDISYETVPIIWVKYNNSVQPSNLLDHLVKHKDLKINDEFYDILGEKFYKNRKGSLMKLSHFLIEHFSEELSDNYPPPRPSI